MTSIIEESKRARQRELLGFWRNKKIIYALLAIVVVGGGLYLFAGKDKQEVESVQAQKEWTVRKDDIIVSVETDGKVVAKDGVELSFSVSGDNLEVDEVFVKEGEKILKGDKIASVKTDTLEFNRRTAYSSYQSSLADYNETMSGATDDEKADAQDRITTAELSLEQAKSSLEEVKQRSDDSIYNAEKAVKTAKEKLDDNKNVNSSEDVNDAYEALVDTVKSINISLESILKDSDEILGIDKESANDDFEKFLGAKDSASFTNARYSYRKAKNESAELNTYSLGLSINSAHSDVDIAAEHTKSTLETFEKHLNDMKDMLGATITSADFTQNELDGLVSNINSNRSSVNTKITTLNTKMKAIDTAKDKIDDYQDDYNDSLRELENTKADVVRNIENAESSVVNKELSLEQAKRDYNEIVAPLTDAELASARSRLTSASISWEKAQYEYDKSTLVSPIDGQVVQLNYAAGDIIVTDNNKPVATIINNDTLFIEVNIEEADISKLKVGQKAYAKFDSLDDLNIEGEISFISLTSETSNNGIVTYLVRVIFNKGENEIREGMTASIDFVTSETNDVLVIPVSAVRNVEGKPSVQTRAGEWQAVTTGFTDGKMVEVISGLNAGDKIVY